MRLVHTTRLELHQFFDSAVPEYAILSHTWGDDEASFQTFNPNADFSRPGFKKILDCCRLAKAQGLEWAWIDTCCIDKTSSAELSEAINSMFAWYQRSKVCFVFLEDLTSVRSSLETCRDWRVDLANCRWFTRGWTLQELLAPRKVIFFDADLKPIGYMVELALEIAAITGIGLPYLLRQENFLDASVARRMSWASRRKTTRTEDIAYSLLGIFDVNMPLLYGEGEKAFLRLQQQIISQSSDETIFAWTSEDELDLVRGILAESPSEFRHSADIYPKDTPLNQAPHTITSRGIRLHVPVSPRGLHVNNWKLKDGASSVDVWLNCVHHDSSDHSRSVGIRLFNFRDPYIVLRSRFHTKVKTAVAEWYRMDAGDLVMRNDNRHRFVEDFIFKTPSPVYVGQSRPAADQDWIKIMRNINIWMTEPGSNRHYNRRVFKAAFATIWLFFAWLAIHDTGKNPYVRAATWAFLYITYCFIIPRPISLVLLQHSRIAMGFSATALFIRAYMLPDRFKFTDWYRYTDPLFLLGNAIALEMIIEELTPEPTLFVS